MGMSLNTRGLLRRGTVLALIVITAFVAVPAQPASAAPATGVAASAFKTCAVTTGGAVKCWGSNTRGQLGDGTLTNRTTPVDVVGLSSGVAAVGGGFWHSCALTTAGGVKCWGDNSVGQLGDGTTVQRTTPVDVVGLSGVAAVAVGEFHTCALTAAGGLKCWGGNSTGPLGDGTTTQRTTPVDVVGLTSGVAAVAAGDGHTCALTTAGGLKCWGYNQRGQLGDGSITTRLTPVDVNGLTGGVAGVSAGGFVTCALTTLGGIKCWGDNFYGQLGDGTNADRSTPVDVAGLTSGVAAVSGSGFHTCALTTAGGLKCWGYNGLGQLGDGTVANRNTPVDVAGLTGGVAAVSLNTDGHTCALTVVGGLKCWGQNSDGQLGDGQASGTSSRTPVDVVGFVVDPASVPGLSWWGLIALAGLMALLLLWQRRRPVTQ